MEDAEDDIVENEKESDAVTNIFSTQQVAKVPACRMYQLWNSNRIMALLTSLQHMMDFFTFMLLMFHILMHLTGQVSKRVVLYQVQWNIVHRLQLLQNRC